MQLLDGAAFAQKIFSELKEKIAASHAKLRLAIVVVGEHRATRQFVEQKKKAGERIGVDVRVFPFEAGITTGELRRRVAEIVHEDKNNGVIVQLPLPPQIAAQSILNAVTPAKDVDVLSARALGDFIVGKSRCMPPVAGAVKVLLEAAGARYRAGRVALVGAGALVGRPVALWLLSEKATFSVVRSTTADPAGIVREADIVISGVGRPKFITGVLLRKGAVVIDAGTAESEGAIVGDVDVESVRDRASFLSPVPGGVGPLTVAHVFRNLAILSGISV